MKVKNPEEIQKMVLSTDYSVKRIFSIVAHIAHGKTTTSDFLLKRAGLLRPEDAGLVQMANFDEEEKARRITIFTHVVLLAFELQGKTYIFQVNDTPGHISFTGEVSRALRGSDGAILVVDGLEGVMTQTETNIRLSVGEEMCKPVLFINKVDRLISELRLAPQDVFTRVDKIIRDVNDLIEKNQPKGVDWRVDFAKNMVTVGSAKDGWGFTFELLQEKGLKPAIVFQKYKEGDVQWLRDNLPLDDCILRMVVYHLPNPQEAMAYRIKRIWPTGDPSSKWWPLLSTSDPKGPLVGMITKHIINPKNFRTTLIGRVFSGTLGAGDTIYLLNMKEKQRIKRLGVQELTDMLDMPAIPAGNLFALDGFICPAGETFINADMIGQEDLPNFESISYVCEPVVSRSIMPVDPTDLAKLGDVTKKWVMADPSASFHLNKEAGEYILSGVDVLQLEVITKRIHEQVKIKIGDPIIVYRERITEKSPEVYTKSSNGHNRIKMFMEPLDDVTMKLIREGEVKIEQDAKDRGKILAAKAGWDSKEARRIWEIYNESVFVDGTHGLQRLDRIKSYCCGAFRDWLNAGILCKEPVVGLKVTFTDATVHVDPAHTGFNEIASMMFSGLSLCFLNAKPRLYEPIQHVDIKTPNGTEGGITAILNQHRGKIEALDAEGEYTMVKGDLPAAETVNIADEFRSATSGRSFFGYQFGGFRPVPPDQEQEIIMSIRKRKKLPEELPNSSSWERFIYKRT